MWVTYIVCHLLTLTATVIFASDEGLFSIGSTLGRHPAANPVNYSTSNIFNNGNHGKQALHKENFIDSKPNLLEKNVIDLIKDRFSDFAQRARTSASNKISYKPVDDPNLKQSLMAHAFINSLNDAFRSDSPGNRFGHSMFNTLAKTVSIGGKYNHSILLPEWDLKIQRSGSAEDNLKNLSRRMASYSQKDGIKDTDKERVHCKRLQPDQIEWNRGNLSYLLTMPAKLINQENVESIVSAVCGVVDSQENNVEAGVSELQKSLAVYLPGDDINIVTTLKDGRKEDMLYSIDRDSMMNGRYEMLEDAPIMRSGATATNPDTVNPSRFDRGRTKPRMNAAQFADVVKKWNPQPQKQQHLSGEDVELHHRVPVNFQLPRVSRDNLSRLKWPQVNRHSEERKSHKGDMPAKWSVGKDYKDQTALELFSGDISDAKFNGNSYPNDFFQNPKGNLNSEYPIVGETKTPFRNCTKDVDRVFDDLNNIDPTRDLMKFDGDFILKDPKEMKGDNFSVIGDKEADIYNDFWLPQIPNIGDNRRSKINEEFNSLNNYKDQVNVMGSDKESRTGSEHESDYRKSMSDSAVPKEIFAFKDRPAQDLNLDAGDESKNNPAYSRFDFKIHNNYGTRGGSESSHFEHLSDFPQSYPVKSNHGPSRLDEEGNDYERITPLEHKQAGDIQSSSTERTEAFERHKKQLNTLSGIKSTRLNASRQVDSVRKPEVQIKLTENSPLLQITVPIDLDLIKSALKSYNNVSSANVIDEISTGLKSEFMESNQDFRKKRKIYSGKVKTNKKNTFKIIQEKMNRLDDNTDSNTLKRSMKTEQIKTKDNGTFTNRFKISVISKP